MKNKAKTTAYGIDFDNTIANTDVVRSAWIKKNLGIDVKPWNTSIVSCIPVIGYDTYERMSHDIYSPEWMAMTPAIEGAERGIRRLSSMSNLYVISEKRNGDVDAIKNWLKGHNLYSCFSDFVEVSETAVGEGDTTRKRACNQFGFDAIVDDDEGHLVSVQKDSVKRVLLKDGLCWKISVPSELYLARNWKEVCKFLDYAK